jgi:hypothetical protein
MRVEDPVEYAVGLWPRAGWGIAIKSLWRRSLAKYPNEVVVQCIENVREERSSERVELAWVLREIKNWKRNWEGGDLEKDAGAKRSDPIDEGDAEWENEEILRTLEAQEQHVLDRLMREVAEVAPLRRSSGPCRQWSRLARGLVWAHGGQQGLWPVPRLDLSPGPEHSSETDAYAFTAPTTPRSSAVRLDTQPSSPYPIQGTLGQSKDRAGCWLSST